MNNIKNEEFYRVAYMDKKGIMYFQCIKGNEIKKIHPLRIYYITDLNGEIIIDNRKYC